MYNKFTRKTIKFCKNILFAIEIVTGIKPHPTTYWYKTIFVFDGGRKIENENLRKWGCVKN